MKLVHYIKPSSLLESHIPASRAAGQASWNVFVDLEQRGAYCTGWDVKYPHGFELEAKAQSILLDPLPPLK